MTKASRATSHQNKPLGPREADEVRVERTMTAQTQKKTICPTPILPSDEDIFKLTFSLFLRAVWLAAGGKKALSDK
jgi:hypothetical protein